MTPSELKDRFRVMMRDEVEPFLWTDEDIYQYMEQAQNDLVRYIGGISDSRSDLTYITMKDKVAYYPISQKILKVVAIYRDDTGEPLRLMNEENMATYHRNLREPVGKVNSVVVGMDQDYVRLDPVPDESEAGLMLRMHVYRLPRPIIQLNSCGEETEALEIHEHHHTHLMTGMAAQAHRKQDAETFDRERADRFNREFLEYADQCKRERERREHRPRVVAYGGY